ncbi:uncharacterized protein RHOBADRAFT_66279, partial [Rhodotorula graminis WP1]
HPAPRLRPPARRRLLRGGHRAAANRVSRDARCGGGSGGGRAGRRRRASARARGPVVERHDGERGGGGGRGLDGGQLLLAPQGHLDRVLRAVPPALLLPHPALHETDANRHRPRGHHQPGLRLPPHDRLGPRAIARSPLPPLSSHRSSTSSALYRSRISLD